MQATAFWKSDVKLISTSLKVSLLSETAFGTSFLLVLFAFTTVSMLIGFGYLSTLSDLCCPVDD